MTSKPVITIESGPTRHEFHSHDQVKFHQPNGVTLVVDFGAGPTDYVHIRAVSPDGKPVSLQVTPQGSDEVCVGGDVIA